MESSNLWFAIVILMVLFIALVVLSGWMHDRQVLAKKKWLERHGWGVDQWVRQGQSGTRCMKQGIVFEECGVGKSFPSKPVWDAVKYELTHMGSAEEEKIEAAYNKVKWYQGLIQDVRRHASLGATTFTSTYNYDQEIIKLHAELKDAQDEWEFLITFKNV